MMIVEDQMDFRICRAHPGTFECIPHVTTHEIGTQGKGFCHAFLHHIEHSLLWLTATYGYGGSKKIAFHRVRLRFEVKLRVLELLAVRNSEGLRQAEQRIGGIQMPLQFI
jgi:hypothetical protein